MSRYDEEQIFALRLWLVKDAEENGVSKACRLVGYSRSNGYRLLKLYKAGGESALRDVSRRKPILKNRVEPELEAAVIALTFRQPTWGQAHVSNELAKAGMKISPSGVRNVWLRHCLETKRKRLEALRTQLLRGGKTPTRA